ncbi:hypothetical protein F0L68_13090 [Solihabitans fulvus]|uniref:Uncharacterized protein n=1 Tax=Solihabitans fulvus TaxID=1892852 RepID=A0A5B2XH91_9PSEU|nr:hypothetical protein [Solihabitans fulvus]KAA2262220.1 hypothetical protein F0L68_13090 [Solihabitans fulvus]
MNHDIPAVILDAPALAALGAGNVWLSRLIMSQPATVSPRLIYAPALCIAAAEAGRARGGQHVAGPIDQIHTESLGLDGALAVGTLVRESGIDFGTAHAIHAARPSAEWIVGRPVVTPDPARYAGHDIAVIKVSG